MILSENILLRMAHSFRSHVVSCVFLLFCNSLFSQDFELIKVQSAYHPMQAIDEGEVEGEIGFFEWGVQVAIPQPLKKNKNTVLIHRIGYANLRVYTEANTTFNGMIEAERYYHAISYNLGLIQTFNPNWRLVVNISPTLASDFGEPLSGDDLLYQANALVINTKRENLKYGFGLAYTTRLGRQVFVPMGLFKYNTKKFEMDIVFPDKMNIMMKTPGNIFSYGLKAGLNGGVFNNTAEVQAASSTIDEVGYSRLIIGPAITWRLKDAININLQGGMSVGRRWEFIDVNDQVIDMAPQPSAFIGLGLSFAPKIKNPEAGLNN